MTLADRIVVMRDGAIQQIGTPDEIYERPRTIFVASFLGSPAINLLEGEHAGRGTLACVPPRRAGHRNSARACGTHLRHPAAGGARTAREDIGAAVPGAPELTGRVDTVMPAGSDLFLGLKVEGADVFVRVGKDAQVREGEEVSLPLVPDRLHLFDGERPFPVRGRTGMSAIGQRLLRREDARFLTGQGRYLDDIAFPEALHVCFIRSPHAHARIIGIDADAARALPGVLCVADGHDFGRWTRPLHMAPPIEGVLPVTVETMPTAKVRFAGDLAACVVAETRWAAEDAAELVAVSYEALPPVLEAESAIAGRRRAGR